MMSAKLLRLQTTEEGQAGFGAEQLKVVLNAFFKVRAFNPLCYCVWFAHEPYPVAVGLSFLLIRRCNCCLL